MLDAETINAGTKFVEAGIKLFDAVGPAWTLCFAVAVCGIVLAWTYFRDQQHDQGWKQALAAKDDMIEQLNEQNRELRVQALVIGRSWSHEEAVALIYRERHLSVDHSDNDTTSE